jgi:hypothetical protein
MPEAGRQRYLLSMLLCIAIKSPENQSIISQHRHLEWMMRTMLPSLAMLDCQLEAFELCYRVQRSNKLPDQHLKLLGSAGRLLVSMASKSSKDIDMSRDIMNIAKAFHADQKRPGLLGTFKIVPASGLAISSICVSVQLATGYVAFGPASIGFAVTVIVNEAPLNEWVTLMPDMIKDVAVSSSNNNNSQVCST